MRNISPQILFYFLIYIFYLTIYLRVKYRRYFIRNSKNFIEILI